MTETQQQRMSRGFAGLLKPGTVFSQLRTAYIPRFGDEFTTTMVRSAKVVVVGAWVMLIALVLLVVSTIATIFATHSVRAGFLAALACFAVIIVGFVINAVGVSQRKSAVAAMSERIMAFDPKVTTDGAGRLIYMPQLYDRWMAQHPGFVSH